MADRFTHPPMIDKMARAIFEAGLPRGKNGDLTPGHTTWQQLGPNAQDRHRDMAQASVDMLLTGYKLS